MKVKEGLIKFWDFLRKDSWGSLAVTLILAAVIILYVIFPILTSVTGTQLPLVIVESCSMYHDEDGFDRILKNEIYDNNGIKIEDTKDWDFQKGLTKGDIIFAVAPKNLEKGDVLIFNAGSGNPIIHRVIDDTEPYKTKGDNYVTNPVPITPGCNPNGCWTTDETNIREEQLIGKAVFKIPYLGWIKLIFFDLRSQNPGAC